jgi:coenzyme PQQ precursor peptide PqqA
MKQSTDGDENTERVWETPIFKEIPIAFEATSYALSDDDDPVYR